MAKDINFKKEIVGNCILPHKADIIQYLEGLGESAEFMQTVYCVVERKGKGISGINKN